MRTVCSLYCQGRGRYSNKTTSKGDRNKQACWQKPLRAGRSWPLSASQRGSTGHGEYLLVTPLTSSHSLFCLNQNLHKHTTHQSRTHHVFWPKRLKKRRKLKSSALRGGHSSYLWDGTGRSHMTQNSSQLKLLPFFSCFLSNCLKENIVNFSRFSL